MNKLEKAITQKYGEETIDNPRRFWDDEKEKEYLEQLKEYSKKQQALKEESERIEKDGFFLPKNLINKKSKRKCLVCITYSFDKRDDLYMNKFQCCWKCYIQWVDGREKRWATGWRPNKGENK